MKTVTLTVNGEKVTASVEPRTHLADFLRGHLHLTGTHLGCEHGVCGACTVLIDGATARACINFAVACDGAAITTIEGFAEDTVMARLRQAFHEKHALQCGFCTPGQLVSARDLLLRLDDADEARIRKEMSANLCRCTGYMGIVDAVLDVFADKTPALLEARKNGAGAPVIAEAATPVTAALSGTQSTVAADGGAATLAGSGTGWTEIARTMSFEHPADAVWQRLKDYELIARCLPGAAIDSIEGDRIAGRFRVALGPITASFHGTAEIEREEAERRGHLRGQGDEKSGATRARGELSYVVRENAGGCDVELAVRYQIQGRLAQFTRAGIVVDFVERLTGEFARNLGAAISGTAPAPAGAPLRAGGMFLSVLWARIKRLFGG